MKGNYLNSKRSILRILRNDWVLVGIIAGLIGGSMFLAELSTSSSDPQIFSKASHRFDSVELSFATQEDSFPTGTPAVLVIHPNGGESWRGTQMILWTATDPQNDSLTYTVYYSPNEGNTWIQITTGLTKSSYTWDTTTLEDGTTYLIQVEASDGQNTGMDVSDATFEIANGQSLLERISFNMPISMTIALVLAAISALAILGATIKAASIPPLRGKRSWKDFLQRIFWYLLYPFIWIFGHVVYGPTLRRLKREDVTANAKRQAILQLLENRGMAYLREMTRAVGIGIFGLKWHLQVLDDFGYVRHRKIGRHLVYFLKEFGASTPSMVEVGFLFKHKTTRAIVDYIRIHPRASQSKIAHAVGVSSPTVHRHALRMKTHELLESISEGGQIQYVLPDEKKGLVDSLLSQIKPED